MSTDRPTDRKRDGATLARIGAWQGLCVAALCTALLVARRGDPPSVLLGAAFLYGSLLLQSLALSFALRAGTRRPGVAIALFLLKLLALIGLVAVGLRSSLLAPMSLVAGAVSLPWRS
jgi:hypothetical protein